MYQKKSCPVWVALFFAFVSFILNFATLFELYQKLVKKNIIFKFYYEH